MFGLRHASALALGALFLLASCANMATVQSADVEDAATESFDAEFDKVVATGLASLRANRLVVRSHVEDQQRATILFIRPGTNGAVGRMIVERSDAPPTVVHINYERRMLLSFAGGQESLSRKVFARMQGEIRFSGPKI